MLRRIWNWVSNWKLDFGFSRARKRHALKKMAGQLQFYSAEDLEQSR